MEVRRAKKRDLKAVKKLADEHRHELGFVRLASLEEAINERRLLVAVDSSPVSRPSFRIIGFVHFRCCKDGHATIYEIAVTSQWRGRGFDKVLINAIIEEAKNHGCQTLCSNAMLTLLLTAFTVTRSSNESPLRTRSVILLQSGNFCSTHRPHSITPIFLTKVVPKLPLKVTMFGKSVMANR
ncbi:Acetyltransferase (GNAT) family protein [Candidatus Fervidibacteria bacterium JGI MDM2 JNZ-1-D12]